MRLKLKVPEPKNKWEVFWLDVGTVAGLLFAVVFFLPCALLAQVAHELSGWIVWMPFIGIVTYGVIILLVVKRFSRFIIKMATALVYDPKTRRELTSISDNLTQTEKTNNELGQSS